MNSYDPGNYELNYTFLHMQLQLTQKIPPQKKLTDSITYHSMDCLKPINCAIDLENSFADSIVAYSTCVSCGDIDLAYVSKKSVNERTATVHAFFVKEEHFIEYTPFIFPDLKMRYITINEAIALNKDVESGKFKPTKIAKQKINELTRHYFNNLLFILGAKDEKSPIYLPKEIVNLIIMSIPLRIIPTSFVPNPKKS